MRPISQYSSSAVGCLFSPVWLTAYLLPIPLLPTSRSEWDAALCQYQLDIGVIDEELDRTYPGKKTKKKKIPAGEETKPQEQEAENLNDDGSDAILPPTDESEVQIALLSENRPNSAPDAKVGSKGGDQEVSKSEESSRFDSVSDLITTLQTFRVEEANLVKQLERENGMSPLSREERISLEEQLKKLRDLQTQQIVASVADHKPRLKASGKNTKLGSSKKSSDLGLNLPSVDDIISEVVPIGGKKRTPQKQAKHPARSNNGGLIKNYTNLSATTKSTLADLDHFLTVHELDINKRPAERSLSALVKRNTSPLNAMEIGRRNRVDR